MTELTTTTPRSTTPIITHARCGATWTAGGAAHCSGGASAVVPFTVWDGDAGFLSKRYADFDECSVDAGGVTPELVADLVSAHPRRVHPRGFTPPLDRGVQRIVLDHGQWTQVLWSVVGSLVVDVVHVISSRDPVTGDAVLVGLDVLPAANLPPQNDVTVGANLPLRLARRDLLARSKGPHRTAGVPPTSAFIAPSALSSADDGRSTFDAGYQWHDWNLQVRTLCCRTFGGVSLFDAHRSTRGGEHGSCVDPETLTNKAGERVAFLRDGMWRGPEMTEEQKRARFGDAA
jgi:hypothetical protein